MKVHVFDHNMNTICECTKQMLVIKNRYALHNTSHAVHLSAPLLAAIMASSPVPVPISKTWTFFPLFFSLVTASVVA